MVCPPPERQVCPHEDDYELVHNPATATEEPNYSPNYQNLPCCYYTTYAPMGSSQIYIVAGHLESGGGISAVSFGIDYTGGDLERFVTFTPCADGEVFFSNDGIHGDFPHPGDGLRISWTTCQNKWISPSGVHAVVGSIYLYAYSKAELWLTPNNNVDSNPELILSDCTGTPTDLSTTGPIFPHISPAGLISPAGGGDYRSGVVRIPTGWQPGESSKRGTVTLIRFSLTRQSESSSGASP